MFLLPAITAHDPTHVALKDAYREITYGDLINLITERKVKLENFRCIALALDNSSEWVMWDLAALACNVPLVPIPPFFTKAQTDHALKAAGCDAIITPAGIMPLAYESVDLTQGTAKVTFTSGTTGTPKGVCLSANAMESVARSIVEVLGKDMAGTHASVLPLAILLENVAGVYPTLLAGGTVYLSSLTSFGNNYATIHQVLGEVLATSVILVPEILRILIAQVMQRGVLPDLKYIAVGGSKVSTDLIGSARKLGLPVYEGYGLSECASVVSLNLPRQDKTGSAGKLLPHIRCRIKDGEITLRNTGFLGYIGEAAPEVIATGDLGEMDNDGFLSITGRKKNVLITSYGRNISPEWVEAELLAQPEIAQAVVYGDAQASLSAYIVPTSVQADVASGVSRANTRLPDYAQVKQFQPIPPLSQQDGTLTGTGRPRRSRVFQLYQKEVSHDVL